MCVDVCGVSLGAGLPHRLLVKDLGFLVKSPSYLFSVNNHEVSSQNAPLCTSLLEACQHARAEERAVRTDELVRGPGRRTGRTDPPGREPPPEEGRGRGDARGPPANKQVRTGESITASLVT